MRSRRGAIGRRSLCRDGGPRARWAGRRSGHLGFKLQLSTSFKLLNSTDQLRYLQLEKLFSYFTFYLNRYWFAVRLGVVSQTRFFYIKNGKLSFHKTNIRSGQQ